MNADVEKWLAKAERREAATVVRGDATRGRIGKAWGLAAVEGEVSERPDVSPACSLQANVLRMKAATVGRGHLL